MSQENVEAIRRLYEAHGQPEFDAVAKALFDADIEWHAAEVIGDIQGRDAVLRHFSDISRAFEQWLVVADELIDVGDEVVGVTSGRGAGRASGATVQARYAIVFTLTEGKVVRGREYATRAEALKAVGLEE